MRPGGLVVAVVLLTACGNAATYDATYDEPSMPLPTRSVFALQPHRTAKLDGCAVEVEPRPMEEKRKVVAEFRARNGADWSPGSQGVDAFTGLIEVMWRYVGKRAREVPIDAESASGLAFAFVEKNHELFGLA